MALRCHWAKEQVGSRLLAPDSHPRLEQITREASHPELLEVSEHQLSVSTGEATAQEGQLDGVGPLSVCACLPTSRASEGIYICQHGQGTNLSIF